MLSIFFSVNAKKKWSFSDLALEMSPNLFLSIRRRWHRETFNSDESTDAPHSIEVTEGYLLISLSIEFCFLGRGIPKTFDVLTSRLTMWRIPFRKRNSDSSRAEIQTYQKYSNPPCVLRNNIDFTTVWRNAILSLTICNKNNSCVASFHYHNG